MVITLKIIPLLTLLLWVQTDQDSVQVVTQAIRGWGDAARLYVLPALQIVLVGVAAALVEWIRRLLKNQAERQNKEAEVKMERDRMFQITLDETNARTLVASVNAEVASRRAELLGIRVEEEGKKQTEHYAALKGIAEKTEHSVNSAAETAQRQIEALTQQLLERGIRPEKGNGPEEQGP